MRKCPGIGLVVFSLIALPGYGQAVLPDQDIDSAQYDKLWNQFSALKDGVPEGKTESADPALGTFDRTSFNLMMYSYHDLNDPLIRPVLRRRAFYDFNHDGVKEVVLWYTKTYGEDQIPSNPASSSTIHRRAPSFSISIRVGISLKTGIKKPAKARSMNPTSATFKEWVFMTGSLNSALSNGTQDGENRDTTIRPSRREVTPSTGRNLSGSNIDRDKSHIRKACRSFQNLFIRDRDAALH